MSPFEISYPHAHFLRHGLSSLTIVAAQSADVQRCLACAPCGRMQAAPLTAWKYNECGPPGGCRRREAEMWLTVAVILSHTEGGWTPTALGGRGGPPQGLR